MIPYLAKAYATAMRPPEQCSPSEFAERYRWLKIGTTSRPGRWRNDVFPYLKGIMDAIQEALEAGRRGVVLMKSGQGGGSEAMINALAWAIYTYPGPALYLISKDEIAKEFGRDRFNHLLDTCEPLKQKAIRGRRQGELLHIKRFVDGKLVLHGGSVLNLQSQPYRFVWIDEVDSLMDNIKNEGDPIRLAEIRTDAYSGRTLIVAFAHPSTRDRGAGKLYYQHSDQRRGHVSCVHCSSDIWLRWDHVKCIPHPGQTEERAERDPTAYRLYAPCCGCEISDAQRMLMCREVRQISTLPEEEARIRPWIGLHFSQLYMPNKPLRFLAEKYIETLEDEPARRVFVNKRLGDVYEEKKRSSSADDWRRMIVIRRRPMDDRVWERGTVPDGVQFLTAGQDSGWRSLHWAIWGWGPVEDTAGVTRLCGWLVDCGVIPRPDGSHTLEAGELEVFDQLLYMRQYPATSSDRTYWVEMGLHDAGWQPLAVYEYCMRHHPRTVPSKGGAEDSTSTQPPFRWGSPPRWIAGGVEYHDPHYRQAILNTYALKINWYDMAGQRLSVEQGGVIEEVPRLRLPIDTPDEFCRQCSAEYLSVDGKKKRWKKRRANHWGDCSVYAYAAALALEPLRKEAEETSRREVQRQSERLRERQRQAGMRMPDGRAYYAHMR